ncbi:MAG: heme-binding protein [Pseudomonadota bacterium]
MFAPLAIGLLAATAQLETERLAGEATFAVIQGCVDYAEKNDLTVAIAVLDDRLQMAGYFRMDTLRQGPAELAIDKADYAAKWGSDTKRLADRVGEGSLGWALASDGPPIEGGVPIYSKDGTLLGGVGVSGAPAVEDAKCARAGIAAAGLKDSRS